MSLFEKIQAARQNKDTQAYADLMAEDCVFVRHQSGTQMKKPEIKALLDNMLGGGGSFGKERCIYENDDILVVHSINDYPDGSREAVMGVYLLKDGKIARFETGATPLPATAPA
ncbi:nuclear transport factor 2 family protein [Tropicimonas marinistellae]|uniref:nuclear transport factor 2 family protein n=1 Tax=Tropicimonas marinistellae TaxID=1739787 RepID=UPI00082CC8BA|nr:nuclear transport factor 2 family protein [Tropicimonas marinistellae]